MGSTWGSKGYRSVHTRGPWPVATRPARGRALRCHLWVHQGDASCVAFCIANRQLVSRRVSLDRASSDPEHWASPPPERHAPVAAGNRVETPASRRAGASTAHSTHRAAALNATREHRSAPSGDCRTPPPRATAASLQAGRARDGRYVRSVPGRMRMGRRARSEAPPKGFRVARQVQTTLAQAERHAHRMLAAGLGSDDDSRQWSEDRGDAGGGPRHLRHQAQH